MIPHDVVISTMARDAPALLSTAVQMALLERYENTYGIYNHDNSNARVDPWAVVRMNDVEDSSTGSTLYEKMALFVEREVTKYFGLSWTEFVSQPTDICNRQMEICLQRQKRKDQEDAGTANALQEAMQPRGG